MQTSELLRKIYTTEITDFINWAYLILLGRRPEEDGLEFYKGRLLSGVDRLEIISQIKNSKESKELIRLGTGLSNEQYIQAVYRMYLLRDADQKGFESYLHRLSSGMSRKQLICEIENSEEYLKKTHYIQRKELFRLLDMYNDRKKKLLFSRKDKVNDFLTILNLSTQVGNINLLLIELQDKLDSLILKSKTDNTPVEKSNLTQPQRNAQVQSHYENFLSHSLNFGKNYDLDWEEFTSLVLSRRNYFKGVFVQEVVIDWDVPLYQRPQHIATALGKLGYLVIYRTPSWGGDNINGIREVSKNVWLTNLENISFLNGMVRSIYSTAYAHSPDSIMQYGKRGLVIYEYIDHIDPEISGNENIEKLVHLKNFAFGGGADFVITSAKKLYTEAASFVGSDKTLYVPNGVDVSHYRNRVHEHTEIPPNLRQFRSKYKRVVGYFGALAPWLWYSCIEELSKLRQDIGFVFIGPDYYGGASKLPNTDNILYLGTVDYKILPAYARKFDVCFIPFKPGEIAKTTSPLKLFEYFALEKPVVVTSQMDECTVYPEVFHGNSAQELSAAIDAAFAVMNNDFYKERLKNLADQNDWLERARSLEKCFSYLKND